MDNNIFDQKMIKWILDHPTGTISNPSGKKFQCRFLIYRMLQSMCQRQTDDELNAQSTHHNNKIGFNKFDAVILTDIGMKSRHYQSLTAGQTLTVAKRLQKYIGQLCDIAGTEYKKNSGKKKVEQKEMFEPPPPTDPADFMSKSEYKKRGSRG